MGSLVFVEVLYGVAQHRARHGGGVLVQEEAQEPPPVLLPASRSQPPAPLDELPGEREDLPHAHPDEHVAPAVLALAGLEVSLVLCRCSGERCVSSSSTNRCTVGVSDISRSLRARPIRGLWSRSSPRCVAQLLTPFR